MNLRTRDLAMCGVLAAAYVALTVLTAGIAYGPVQFRIAEAFCLLPMVLPKTVWGLATGCLLANLFSTVTALDAVVGTLATLLAALWTRRVARLWLAPLPMTVCNAVLVGAMLAWVYTPEAFASGFVIMAAQVGFGELAVGYLLGVPLVYLLRRTGTLERLK